MALCAALPAQAADFSVNLGDTMLGQLSFQRAASGETVKSWLNNTPLGVFNGTFTGTSRNAGAAVREFVGVSQSSRKSRKVTVQISKGRAISTTVTPASEETDLSDIARVPDSVINPVQAIGYLIDADGCPQVIRIYDGRRVIALTPKAAQSGTDTLICDISYTVIAGPGHLSPLRIASANMRLTYATAGQQNLRQIRMRSGIFTVTLDRLK